MAPKVPNAKAQGWLEKPAGMFKSFKPHFVVLFEDKIDYFKDDNDVTKPIRSLMLSGCKASAVPSKPQQFQIQGPSLKKTYVFQAESDDDSKLWLKKIETCITKLGEKKQGGGAAAAAEAPPTTVAAEGGGGGGAASKNPTGEVGALSAAPETNAAAKKELPKCVWCKEDIDEVAGKFSGIYHENVDGGKVHDECRTAYELDKRGKKEGRGGLQGQVDFAAAQVEGDEFLDLAEVKQR